MANPSRPLDGITVVSLEQAIAAPFCTRQLADLGAMEEFAHVGVGRDDGKAGGEFSPVFWRKKLAPALCGSG